MTHYETLNLSPQADPQHIEAAYRQQIQVHHPSHYRGNATAAQRHMARVHEAYNILSDERRRRRYDEALARQAQRGPTPLQQLNTALQRVPLWGWLLLWLLVAPRLLQWMSTSATGHGVLLVLTLAMVWRMMPSTRPPGSSAS
ncbi:MAG: J domain-containing protein [Vampirovibrionales bacterium]